MEKSAVVRCCILLGQPVGEGRFAGPVPLNALSACALSKALYCAFIVSHTRSRSSLISRSLRESLTTPQRHFFLHEDRDSIYILIESRFIRHSMAIGESLCVVALEKPAVFEVVLYDDVRDGVEDEPNVVGVGCAREMGVHLLLVLALVEVLELHLNVGRRVLVRVRAFVLWKTDGERTVPDLLGEEVFLVEEEDNGGVDEPLVVADRVEELHALHHAVHLLVLGEHEVEPAERHAEDDGRHALEAVDPLLPLRPLTADVEHFEFESLERELRLDDARRLDPGPEHVLLRGHVVGAADPVEGVEIVGGAVVELILARPREAVLHPLVHPQAPHQLTDLVRQLHLVSLAGHLEEEPRVLQSLSVGEIYPELAHGADDGQEALYCVGVNDRAVVLALLGTVPSLVDDLHLLHDRRLAALAGAEQEKFDLPRRELPVPSQLLIDLLGALSGLLLVGRQRATHVEADQFTRVPELELNKNLPRVTATIGRGGLRKVVHAAAGRTL